MKVSKKQLNELPMVSVRGVAYVERTALEALLAEAEQQREQGEDEATKKLEPPKVTK